MGSFPRNGQGVEVHCVDVGLEDPSKMKSHKEHQCICNFCSEVESENKRLRAALAEEKAANTKKRKVQDACRSTVHFVRPSHVAASVLTCIVWTWALRTPGFFKILGSHLDMQFAWRLLFSVFLSVWGHKYTVVSPPFPL